MDDAAMMHYRVQITGTDAPLRETLRREIPLRRRFRRKRETSATTVRIFDRAGAEVATFRHDGVVAADAQHNEIVDDLIRLDVEAFREKYGLSDHSPPT